MHALLMKSGDDESTLDILRHNLKHHKLLIVIELDRERGTYERRQSWTELKKETIYRLGFKKAEKFLDKLAYTGTPAYVKLVNFTEAEPTNLETSSTLADFHYSRALSDFERGLTKTVFPTLDKKQIIAILPILLGAIIGVYLLFGR